MKDRDERAPQNHDGARARLGTAGRIALFLVLAIGFVLRVAYGWPSPNANRAVDERYSLENAEMLLRNGAFRPSNAFHPSLSFLPQTLVLAAVEACGCLELGTGTREVLAPLPGWTPEWRPPVRSGSGLRSSPRLTPLAFRSCRLFQAVLGTAVVGLTFVLGRLLFTPLVGLLAALLLALTPWQIWASGICNEDAGFVLAFLGGILATIACVRRPTTLRFVLAGLAFGLAGSAKYNALPVVVPLTVWALAKPALWRARLPRLALAGALAIGLVLALNPHFLREPEMLRRDFFGKTMRNYEMKTRMKRDSRLGVALDAFSAPLAHEVLGPAVGTLAVAGLGFLLVLGWRRRRSRPELLVAAGFPLGYTAVYVAATGNSSAHNWMPLDPVFAVAAVALLVAVALRLAARRRFRRPVAGAVALSAVLALALVGPAGVRYVYTTTVPPNLFAAERWLENRCQSRAVIGVEPRIREGSAWSRPRLDCVQLIVPRGHKPFSAAELEELDGWITEDLADRARAGKAAGLVARGGEVARFDEVRFEHRGAPVLAVWRPWRPLAVQRIELGPEIEPGHRQFELSPQSLPGAVEVSLQIFPMQRWRPGDCTLRELATGHKLGLARAILESPKGAKRLTAETRRFELAAPARFEIACPARRGKRAELDDFVLATGWMPVTGATAGATRR